MKRIPFLHIIAVLIIVTGLKGCQTPEDLTPPISKQGINSFTASFPNSKGDENSFEAEIDYENKLIVVVIPYNYPANSNNIITEADITNMSVSAGLDDNVFIEPKLLHMDLSKENFITVIEQTKQKVQYKVIGEIRKSEECLITKFTLSAFGLNGVINETNKTISLVTIDSIGKTIADISISHGAVISPDPRIEPQNYEDDVVLTVTAQNGVDKSVYTVKKSIPKKIPNGLRPGSKTILWAKKLSEVGVTTADITTGIAVTDEYVILNSRGENSIYIDSRTGEKIGEINLGTVKGIYTNFYGTADNNNNILVCNRTPEDGATFKIWKISDVNSIPEEFISWDTSSPLGRKFSVKGDINSNAIITAPIYQSGQFARWQVTGGTIVSQTPDIVTTSGVTWTTHADLVYGNAFDITSDYFASFFVTPASNRKATWFNGSTNAVRQQGPEISTNWIPNAIDHVIFNNIPYVVHNTVNSFTWGSDDMIYMYDLSVASFSSQIDVAEKGIYGGNAGSGVNSSGTGDVAFKVSDNGYYLYVYFMFTNGSVVCVQFDCIDM